MQLYSFTCMCVPLLQPVVFNALVIFFKYICIYNITVRTSNIRDISQILKIKEPYFSSYSYVNNSQRYGPTDQHIRKTVRSFL